MFPFLSIILHVIKHTTLQDSYHDPGHFKWIFYWNKIFIYWVLAEYFVFCTTTRALTAKRIRQPDSATFPLQLWFLTIFLDFLVSRSFPGWHISFLGHYAFRSKRKFFVFALSWAQIDRFSWFNFAVVMFYRCGCDLHSTLGWRNSVTGANVWTCTIQPLTFLPDT